MANESLRANKPKSIDEALRLLDDAMIHQPVPETTVSDGVNLLKSTIKGGAQAQTSQASELFNSALKTVTGNFHTVAGSLGASSAIAFEQLNGATANGMEQTKEVIANVDAKVRENPWPYIGGAAVGMFALGFFLARRDELRVQAQTPARLGVETRIEQGGLV